MPDDTLPQEKTCSKCGETKPLGEFYREARARDGRRSRCKCCVMAESKAWQRANPKRAARRVREWIKKNPKRMAELRKNERLRDSVKCKARATVGHAVHDGKLHKPNRCENCGKVAPSRELHAHHQDYSKPLEVEWLCLSCHGKRHRADPS